MFISRYISSQEAGPPVPQRLMILQKQQMKRPTCCATWLLYFHFGLVARTRIWALVLTNERIQYGNLIRKSVLLHGKKLFLVSNSRSSTTAVSSTTASTTSQGEPDVEIRDFETWFRATKGAEMDERIQYGQVGVAVGNLRGLLWEKDSDSAASSTTTVEASTRIATIPKSIVLSTEYKNSPSKEDDWDSKLAVLLWNAVKEEKSSTISGYCRLLLQGTSAKDTTTPKSTAPHALRHWSTEQRNVLAESIHGRKLLQLEVDQTKAWKRKFHETIYGRSDTTSVSSSSWNMSWEQFQWAMEVVHSRAFCGVQTDLMSSSLILPIVTAVPVLAIAAISSYTYQYSFVPSLDNKVLLAAVAATTLTSLLATIWQQQRCKSAVLLPLIDSANHLESADSSIVYDPLKQSFELWIGPKCLVQEENGQTQLYISYGSKSKEELLLNYGFLPGVPLDPSDDVYRVRLAKSYQEQ